MCILGDIYLFIYLFSVNLMNCTFSKKKKKKKSNDPQFCRTFFSVFSSLKNPTEHLFGVLSDLATLVASKERST